MSCKCERQNFLDAYEDEMEHTLEEMKIDSPTTEARIHVAHTLRPRFALDRQSAERETNNISEYEVPEAEFTVTPDGRVLYTKYNRTLDELHERQRELQPDQYSVNEHDTSRLIERMFQRGATEVVTSYSRAEGDNRDIVVMRFDPITRIGTTHIINTQVDGSNHDFQTIQGIAKDKFTHLAEATSGEHLFVLSNAPVRNEKIVEGIKSFQESKQYDIKKIAPSMDTVVLEEFAVTSRQVREKVTQDIKDTIRGVQRYVQTTQKHHPKKEDVPPFYVRLFGLKKSIISDRDKDFLSPGFSSNLQSVDTQKTIIRHVQHEVNYGSNHTNGDKQVDRKKSNMVLTTVFETEPIKRGKGMQVEKKQPPFRKEKRLIEKEKKLKRQKISIPLFHESPVILINNNNEKKRDESSGNQKNLPQRYTWMVQQLRRIEQSLLKQDRASNNHINKENESKNDREKRTEQIIMVRVTQLILIWLITSYAEKHSLLKQTTLTKKIGSEYIYRNYQHNETPWILFSIIWYLVMLREQGKVTIQKKQKKKKTNNVNIPTVIFAYERNNYIQTQSIFVI